MTSRPPRSAADRAIANVDLDTTGRSWAGETVSLRWVLVHMIEETPGHADIERKHRRDHRVAAALGPGA